MPPDENKQERFVEGLNGDFVQLSEQALRRDGTAALRLIGPGWGTSGYYPAEVLERDGPTVFRAGTKMYWDHPTLSEEAERPEGSLRDLAAVLVEDARWDENGPEGPGLYADARIFEGYQQPVEEMAPHIGVSIRANGRARSGEAEGREGPIITALTNARSVDFVTDPGAGGRIVQLFEAARRTNLREARNVGEWLESRLHLHFTQIADEMFGEGRLSRDERMALSSAIGDALDAFRAAVASQAAALYDRDLWDGPPTDNEQLPVEESGREANRETSNRESSQEGEMEKLEQLQEQLETAQAGLNTVKAERDRLREALLLRDAQEMVREALAESDLPEVTKQRLARTVAANPPVTDDGRLNEAGLKGRIEEAVEAERNYLREAAGWGDGRIQGMGSKANGEQPEESRSRMRESFLAMGMSEAEADAAVTGRRV